MASPSARARRLPWQLAQYDVLAGQVWIAVPLTLLVAPLAFGR